MSTTYDLPMPMDAFDGGHIVASCWDDDESGTYTVLMLMPEEPFYAVREYQGAGKLLCAERFENIAHAAIAYNEATNGYIRNHDWAQA